MSACGLLYIFFRDIYLLPNLLVTIWQLTYWTPWCLPFLLLKRSIDILQTSSLPNRLLLPLCFASLADCFISLLVSTFYLLSIKSETWTCHLSFILMFWTTVIQHLMTLNTDTTHNCCWCWRWSNQSNISSVLGVMMPPPYPWSFCSDIQNHSLFKITSAFQVTIMVQFREEVWHGIFTAGQLFFLFTFTTPTPVTIWLGFFLFFFLVNIKGDFISRGWQKPRTLFPNRDITVRSGTLFGSLIIHHTIWFFHCLNTQKSACELDL